MSWDQRFFDPIILTDGRKLVTLRDAALYVTKLPEAEHDAPEWQAAMQALMMIGEQGGDPMMALGHFEGQRDRGSPSSFATRLYS